MCAINGITGYQPELIQRMNTATKHRGPDGMSIFADKHITFGHNRLAIIDTDTRSDQPMTSASGRYTIVFNGEIYNFQKLRTYLSDQYLFKTKGDTEVILAAFERWGKEALRKIEGMFAFALFDHQMQEILLVRDPVGIKPLYYVHDGNALYFSSELSGLITAGFAALDHESARLYLALQYVPSPRTLIKNVYKLEPGECITYTAENKLVHTFYDDVWLNPERHLGEKKDIVSVIDTAVSDQLISDRPVGIFLSGGLDSSIVLHHAVKHNPAIKTFSVDFELTDYSNENVSKFNQDAILAKKTAAHYGTEHSTFTLTYKDVAEELSKAFVELDEPIANPTSFVKYFLSKRVRETGIVVALGGDGGDEVFRGYDRYQGVLLAEYLQYLPRPLPSLLGYFHPRIKQAAHALGPHFQADMMFNSHLKNDELFTQSKETLQLLENIYSKRYQRCRTSYSQAECFMRVDASTWLSDESLQSTDRATMAHGLEYRVPLLDKSVISYANQFSTRAHIGPWARKKLLYAAYGNLLPGHLFNQPKRGWFSPAAKWLRSPEIEELYNELLLKTITQKSSEIFKFEYVQQIYQKHSTGVLYALHPIWNILQLQIWVKHHSLNF